MKRKNVQYVLLLLGVVLLSCNQTPIDDGNYLPPVGRFTYYSTVEIDSAASACGVDSCVINLPWLNNKINAFLKDSAERKKKIETSLWIEIVTHKNFETEEINTYMECYLEDYEEGGTLWLDCAGDTIYKDPDYCLSMGDTTSDFVWFIDVLNNSGITDEQKIVDINFGYECGGI